MTTDNDDRARTRAILEAPEAANMQWFARRLAFETDLSLEVAVGCMKALAEDLANERTTKNGSGDAFLARKRAAGTLGLGAPENRDDPRAVAEGWAKAAADVNAKHGFTH